MVIPSTKMREHPMNCMQEGRSIVPVSYTHLDVYKRQLLCREQANH